MKGWGIYQAVLVEDKALDISGRVGTTTTSLAAAAASSSTTTATTTGGFDDLASS